MRVLKFVDRFAAKQGEELHVVREAPRGLFASTTEWVRSTATVTGVIGSLCVFDVIQRVANLGGTTLQQHATTKMAQSINQAVRLSAKIEFYGRKNIVKGQPYIVVSNHQSILDISMITEFLFHHSPRYVSKLELGRGVPGVSYNLRKGGSALIDRKDPRQAHEELERVARRVKDSGWTVVIFPEGTRSKTGAMKPFRPSGLRTLVTRAPGIPILPLTSSGGSKYFQHDLRPLVSGVTLGFRAHPAVMPPDPSDAKAFDAFVHELEAIIASGLPKDDMVPATL